jgi:alpha-L-arabinofuranosidase
MAAFTMGTSTLDVTPTAATLNSTGIVFKLYAEHFGEGTIPIAVEGQAPQPAPKYPVGFGHPQVRAGSPTYPLDIVAGLSADGGTLKVGIVNPTDQVQWLAINLKGRRAEGDGREWRMSGATLEAANTVGAVPGVTVTDQARPLSRPLKIEPATTTVLEYRTRRPRG